MKKLILMTAMLVFTISVFGSLSAFALTDGDWEFQLLDSEATITAYIGDDTDIVIPDTLYGAPVTKVELKGWEKNFEGAKSVTFPKTVKEIGQCGWGAELEAVYLLDGVEKIKENAFHSCTNLKTVILPSTLKEIGKQAFSHCSSLTHVDIPASVTKIGSWGFGETGLKEIDFSKSNIELGDHVVAYCHDLETVKLNENLKEISDSMFRECVSLKTLDIPAAVELISFNAFENCTALEQIILPSQLKEIRYAAFSNTALQEVIIPYGTEEIHGAFSNNSKLQSIYIPDTVTYIDTGILYNSPNCIVYCTSASYTADLCKKNSISYLTDTSVNSGITVLYNGRRVSFHSYGQNPEISDSRTLVPLRSIFEAMGADVQWNQDTSTATAKRGSVEVKIQIGANQMYKNGKAISVDVPAKIIGGRTMVPVRVIAEAFGAEVKWNGNGRTVLINE